MSCAFPLLTRMVSLPLLWISSKAEQRQHLLIGLCASIERVVLKVGKSVMQRCQSMILCQLHCAGVTIAR